MHFKPELKSIANSVLWQAAVILNPKNDLVHTTLYPKLFLDFQA
jgi:hypothetical protein